MSGVQPTNVPIKVVSVVFFVGETRWELNKPTKGPGKYCLYGVASCTYFDDPKVGAEYVARTSRKPEAESDILSFMNLLEGGGFA